MITLMTTVKFTNNTLRNEELLYCLEQNLKNDYISNLIILTEDVENFPVKADKIALMKIKNKPTFQLLIEIAKYENLKYLCISNFDIFFDETLSYITSDILDEDYAICLTRWNYDLIHKSSYFMNVAHSFDSYIFSLPIQSNNFNFQMGVPGCDNKMVYQLHANNKKVINPSRLIKTFHVHDSGYRTYTEADRLHGDYMSIEPTDRLEYNFKNIYFQ